LRPAEAVEEFLKLIVDNDSAVSMLGVVRGVVKSRVEGFEAYARVLLDWYTHEKFWCSVGDDEFSVESLLLDSLKVVVDPDLRKQVEETLIAHQREIYFKKKETK